MSLFNSDVNVNEIDYLFEDPAIPGQNFALVSIVGPNFKQKCNVYGLKVRGVADTLEKAKSMSQKLTKVDPDFDIYTVEIGKFFPLDVDPMQLNDVEYQNTQLNSLIKNYLENRENANNEYERRKNEMVKKAISDNKLKENSETVHPIAVLNRIEELKERVNIAKTQLEELTKALSDNKTEYSKFTLDVQKQAEEEYEKLKEEANNKQNVGSSSSSKVIN